MADLRRFYQVKFMQKSVNRLDYRARKSPASLVM